MSLLVAAFGTVCLVLLFVGLLIWMLGMRQPSQGLLKHKLIIFVALKSADPAKVFRIDGDEAQVIWRGRTVFPLIGPADDTWTDFLLLHPDATLVSRLQGSDQFDDVYAATVRLTKVPAFALGFLRLSYLLGLSGKPNQPIPDSFGEAETLRTDLLPSPSAILAAKTAPSDLKVTMMNFLAYKSDEDGSKETGRRLYNRYGREAMKAVHGVGGQFLFAGQIDKVLIPSGSRPDTEAWDDLAAMIYPSPTAIFLMEQNEDYRSALPLRDKSLDRTSVLGAERV